MKKQWGSIFKAFTIFEVFAAIFSVLLLVSINEADGKPFHHKKAKGGIPLCLEQLNDSVNGLKICNTDLDQTRTDLGSCYSDLDQTLADLETCNTDLYVCDSNQVSCPEVAPVVKTGQTTSYTAGDDGDLQAGIVWTAPRFIDNGDGTVTDTLTGLIWMKNAGSIKTSNWENAIQSCSTLAHLSYGLWDGSYAGDWRLPNIRELYSLIDFGHYNYALPDGHLFINVMSNYWSSTIYAGNPGYAIFLNLISGNMNYTSRTSSNLYALCVRNSL